MSSGIGFGLFLVSVEDLAGVGSTGHLRHCTAREGQGGWWEGPQRFGPEDAAAAGGADGGAGRLGVGCALEADLAGRCGRPPWPEPGLDPCPAHTPPPARRGLRGSGFAPGLGRPSSQSPGALTCVVRCHWLSEGRASKPQRPLSRLGPGWVRRVPAHLLPWQAPELGGEGSHWGRSRR